MRTNLKTHLPDGQDDNGLEVQAPDPGARDQAYVIRWRDKSGVTRFTEILFQNGPVPDGRNGVTLEALLAIVLHRLEQLQGEFPCQENQFAWANFSAGLEWLHTRTRDRQSRGVEGKLES